MSEEFERKAYKIWQLSDKEMGSLLIDNFFKLGVRILMPPDELKKFILEVHKYQGRVSIDDFNEAFSKVAAGDLEVEEKPKFSPWYIGRVMKAFRGPLKTNQQSRFQSKNQEFNDSTDKGWFDSLNAMLQGEVSERRKKAFPNVERPDPGIIPVHWNWEAVYRHLLSLKEVDYTEESKKMKSQVILWIYNKNPKAIRQESVLQTGGLMQNIKKMMP